MPLDSKLVSLRDRTFLLYCRMIWGNQTPSPQASVGLAIQYIKGVREPFHTGNCVAGTQIIPYDSTENLVLFIQYPLYDFYHGKYFRKLYGAFRTEFGTANSCALIWRLPNLDAAGRITADILHSQLGKDMKKTKMHRFIFLTFRITYLYYMFN